MKSTVGADVSEFRELSRECMTEWHSLRTRHHNALLEGPRAVTEAVLLLLKPDLRKPIRWRRPGMPLALPDSDHGTLVLQEVAALDPEQQTRVLRWLDDTRQQTQTIATATMPLFPLLARGLFDEKLYYRLNVVLLRVEASQNLELRA